MDQATPRRLEGQVAIVTAAGGEIGRQHALLLAQHGAKVVVNDAGSRSGEAAKAVADDIRAAGGDALANYDAPTWEGAPYVVDAAIEVFGRVDILINNTADARPHDLADLAEAEWDCALDLNLTAHFAMNRAVAPHMSRQGCGVIVNISAPELRYSSRAAYGAAREGVAALARTVAREFGRSGVRCNVIHPLAACPHEGDRGLLRVQGIAPFTVWLCTEAAANVNGHAFEVGGGTISRIAEPVLARTVAREAGWDLDSLDAIASVSLVDGLVNQLGPEDHPESCRL